MIVRNATPFDFSAILALNAESVRFLSALDEPHLQLLHAQAAYHRVVEIDNEIGAFLLVLRKGVDYDSPNYRWFVEHYDRFLYIDRIVVSTTMHGRGLAALLYDDLLAFAAQCGVDQLTCEFDLDPPNPASAKFHARFGFREVGKQWIRDGKKQVSLQALDVQA